MTRRWLPAFALVPAGAGLLVAAATQARVIGPSLLFLSIRAGMGTVAAAVGIAVSGIALVWMALKHRRSQATQAAVSAERCAQLEARRRFIHRLDHELKNPLTAIRAGLANIERSDQLGPGPSLTNIGGQVERLTRLVNDLRKLTDLEMRGIERTMVELPALIEEAVELARSIPGSAGRQITVGIPHVPWAPGPVQGDADLLVLALYNLLDNALKFSPAGTTVEVRATEDGTAALVEIANTGRGIPAEELPHLTEELFRGRETQGIEGSGLGLALVDRIIRLHGGGLAIRSREGQGTVVTIRLPLARP
jgi:two-component system OmpR family sensor kinase